MKFQTVAEYQKEFARVKTALEKTKSDNLRRDYGKYLRRLEREMKKTKYTQGA